MNYLFSHGYLNFCFPFQVNISCKEAANRLDYWIISFGSHYRNIYLPIQVEAYL